MKTYQETIDFLYTQLPVYQKEGKAALNYKLNKIRDFCQQLDNPQNQFKSIHIAGTNGKGSSSHMLASVLQEAGYKVGLYTSPHLKNFTERIKVSGKEVENDFVIEFVDKCTPIIEHLKPSFFEMTVAMAFDYFAQQKVDYAIIEVGLGGRFDSTNIINPLLSIITNISLDHQNILGDTLAKIASEKAGIIKSNVPVVIGEYHDETFPVFQKKVEEVNTELYKAFENVLEDNINLPNYQLLNRRTVQMACGVLAKQGLKLSNENIKEGLTNYVKNTNLKGRWQQLQKEPLVICDTGHNEAGIQLLVEQINKESYDQLFIILGMVNDKDTQKILSLLPKEAYYYFCQASLPRALNADILKQNAQQVGLRGEVILDVNNAIAIAKKNAKKNDFIYIGGSTFVVAEIKDL